jgi:hypothetical protein
MLIDIPQNTGFLATWWLHDEVSSMARPSKSTPLDLTQTHDLTVGTIERLTCPHGKAQAFCETATPPRCA